MTTHPEAPRGRRFVPDTDTDTGPAVSHDADRTAQQIAHVLQHGQNPDADAARVLRKAMCSPAGRDLVEHALLRPFGYSLAPGRVVSVNSHLRDALEQLEACVADEVRALRDGGDPERVADVLSLACETARRNLDHAERTTDAVSGQAAPPAATRTDVTR